jgi:crotonobetainyl-CoA:carnitine CoA-transferase CaiB-like acyl-CoA transferase
MTSPLPLEGIRVVDAASLFAGPVIATMLGDYGADVIKVEHPAGDNLRKLGWEKDGVSLWWALIGRNKRSVTLKLSDPQGAEAMRRLLATADVFVENFRTGTLERWGLGWEMLHELNPKLVMVRTTGFGQDGPYARRPGFGTLAESMSGYAHINGFPDGPPTLPPFALGDGVAALTGAFATMTRARWDRADDRPVDLRAAVLDPRTAGLGLRPARDRAGAHRQPGAVHGSA